MAALSTGAVLAALSRHGQTPRLLTPKRRRRAAEMGALSVLLHMLGLAVLDRWIPEHQIPDEEPIALSLMAIGHAEAEADAPNAEEDSPQPEPQPEPEAQPEPVITPPVPTPQPEPASAPPEAPQGTVAPSPEREAPIGPMTFAQWRQAQRTKLAAINPHNISPDPRGAAGPDRATSRGVKRCEPAEGRRAEVVYLLFDSSGSMSRWRKDLAISCAQQYARASLELGAQVGVANFADATSVTAPSTNLTTIGAALRDNQQGRGTRLPTSELRELFLTQGDGPAELVIVSDGYLPNIDEALPWLQYFLESHPDNRGYLYTIRQGGAARTTSALSRIGFYVKIYDVI